MWEVSADLSLPSPGETTRESHPAGGAPGGHPLHLHLQVRAGRMQARSSRPKSGLYHQMAISQFPLVFFPSVPLACSPAVLHPCCKIHFPRRDSFAQIHLRRGIASSFLGDAQLSILHPGRLFLMSLSYGLKTSYFEIPLLL